MAPVTQEFIDALKEQDKVDFIKTIRPLKIADADQIKIDLLSLHTPVDLTALKSEVDLIEGTHFKGVHASLLILEGFHSAATAKPGDYAYIKDGVNPEKIALLDAGAWVEYVNGGSGGGGVPLTAAQIKALYETNADTNPFRDADKATLAALAAGGGGTGGTGTVGPKGDKGDPGVAGPKGDQGIPGVAGPSGTQDISGKVDKVAGKVLSSNDYTDGEKAKLAGLEGSHFKGTHADEAALIAAQPTAEVGSYAYVLVHGKEHNFIWDGSAWVDTGAAGAPHMTDAQLKAQYENNPDTNPFDDAAKQAIIDLKAATHGVAYTIEIPTDPDTNLKTPHITTDVPMRMLQPQVIPLDHAIALGSRELMTVGNVVAMFSHLQTQSMMDKGTISDIDAITETGIYEGVDVTDSPITGEIMVMANKDSHGDFGFFLMGDDRTMHTGGKKAGGVLGWQQVKHVTQSTGEIAVEVAGGFTTIKTNMYANLFGTDLMDGDEHVVTFMMAPNSPEIPDGDANWGYMLPHVADQTGQPIRLRSAGLAGTPNGVVKLWIDKKALITLKKVDKDNPASDWEVTHVEIPANGGATHLTHGAHAVPPAPTADGEYKLKVAAGVITWETV